MGEKKNLANEKLHLAKWLGVEERVVNGLWICGCVVGVTYLHMMGEI